jgi:hypothetical protein
MDMVYSPFGSLATGAKLCYLLDTALVDNISFRFAWNNKQLADDLFLSIKGIPLTEWIGRNEPIACAVMMARYCLFIQGLRSGQHTELEVFRPKQKLQNKYKGQLPCSKLEPSNGRSILFQGLLRLVIFLG